MPATPVLKNEPRKNTSTKRTKARVLKVQYSQVLYGIFKISLHYLATFSTTRSIEPCQFGHGSAWHV